VAICLIVAQILPSFMPSSKIGLTVANLWGIFMNKLVPHCIILRAKKGRPEGRPHILWL
jgi:hypothetical protein